MELLEKTLANEKEEQNLNNTIPKKKVIKVNSDNKKKQILLSKPSKKEKKYSYYTDYLDEKGHFLEGKYNKNTHPKSGRNKSSNSNKKNSFSQNKSFLSENFDLKINQKSLKIINENEENKKIIEQRKTSNSLRKTKLILTNSNSNIKKSTDSLIPKINTRKYQTLKNYKLWSIKPRKIITKNAGCNIKNSISNNHHTEKIKIRMMKQKN